MISSVNYEISTSIEAFNEPNEYCQTYFDQVGYVMIKTVH